MWRCERRVFVEGRLGIGVRGEGCKDHHGRMEGPADMGEEVEVGYVSAVPRGDIVKTPGGDLIGGLWEHKEVFDAFR